MNKHVRKACLLLLSALLLLLLSAPALALPDATEDFYVADYAAVLRSETKETILRQNELLYEQTGGQIVVVTVRYLESGYYADEYAVQLFHDWGVGDAERNNGLLLLLVTEEGKAWLTQGDGIKTQLTNDDINALLEKYFWKKFDQGDYDGAVSALFPQLIHWYENTYKLSLTEDSTLGGTQAITPTQGRSWSSIVIAVIVILLLLYIFRGGVFRNRPRRYSNYGPGSSAYTPYRGFTGFGRRGGYRGGGFSSGGYRSPGSRFGGSSYRSSSGSFGSGSRSSGGSRSSFGGGHSGGGGRSGGGGGGRR